MTADAELSFARFDVAVCSILVSGASCAGHLIRTWTDNATIRAALARQWGARQVRVSAGEAAASSY